MKKLLACWLSSQAKESHLHDNQLTGLLPTEIGFLTILNDFQIPSNMFTGAIPTEIGLMSSLSKFCLSETDIS